MRRINDDFSKDDKLLEKKITTNELSKEENC